MPRKRHPDRKAEDEIVNGILEKMDWLKERGVLFNYHGKSNAVFGTYISELLPSDPEEIEIIKELMGDVFTVIEDMGFDVFHNPDLEKELANRGLTWDS